MNAEKRFIMNKNKRKAKQVYDNPTESSLFVMPTDEELKKMHGFPKDAEPSEDIKKMMQDIAYQTWLMNNKKGKVAAILVSIPIYILSGLATYAIGSHLFQLIANEENTDIIIETDNIISLTELEAVYTPSFLPEGYELQGQDVWPERATTLFYNEESGTTIVIRQNLPDFSYSYDTEETDYEEFFTINDKDAVYYTKHGNGYLLYYFENYLFLIDISDIEEINQENTIKIANSLTEMTEDESNEKIKKPNQHDTGT